MVCDREACVPYVAEHGHSIGRNTCSPKIEVLGEVHWSWVYKLLP